ncbi:hypothetical protein [Micromonospora sp. CB01531]|uniref:hypothetical protein n=1 Tax=Micromonospora sp. CB01531 TaxID=1718947 RepID=UPI00093BB0E3|nr:hypothetical protein [Micromonospora sp. CB01531]OKI52835.1 hypothetical protein A6A27_08050 [Micromonospora sp. CB01531]
MTGMVDDIGQRGDVAVASLIVEAHRRCRDCKADRRKPRAVPRCETGAWAAQLLAAHRAWRRQQTTGRNQRPTEYQGAQ